MSSQRILSQCRKELQQFRRDRITMGLAFLLPLLTLFIFGFAIRLEASDIPIAVQDLDRSPLSRAYIERLVGTNQFRPVPFEGNDPVTGAVDRGRARAAVIVPPGFSRRIAAGRSADLQVLVDGSDANNARIVRNGIEATTRFFLRQQGLLPAEPPIEAVLRLWFNPGRREALSIVPGVYAVVLWIFPSLLTAIALVREKESGTILQVYACGVSARDWLLGKGLAYLLVGLAMALLVMGLGGVVFGLGLAGDPTPLLAGTLLYLAAAVAFGLLLGARSRNQNAAVQGVALIGFISALLLSGFIYPVSNIPFPLSLLSRLVPARYFILVTRDAFVRGTGWPGVVLDVGMILVMGTLFLALAHRSLRPMQLSG